MDNSERMGIGQHIRITVGPCAGQEAYIAATAHGAYLLSDSMPSDSKYTGEVGLRGLWVLREYVEKARGQS